MNMSVRLGTVLSVLALAAACSGEVRSPDFTPILQRIDITPAGPLTLVESDTRQLTATAFFTTPPSQGDTLTERVVTNEVTWTSSDATVASVTATGGLTAESPSQASISIRATLDGVSDTLTVTVIAGTLSEIEINTQRDCTGSVVPSAGSDDNRIPEGLSGQFGAEAIFRDTTQTNQPIVRRACVTDQATWTSSSPSNLCVESAGAPTNNCPQLPDPLIGGRVFGELVTPDNQPVMMTAQFSDANGNSQSSTVEIDVIDTTLQDIFLCPDERDATSCSGGVELARGDSTLFRVYGQFSDGSCRDITGLAGSPPSQDSSLSLNLTSAASNSAVVRVDNYQAGVMNGPTGGVVVAANPTDAAAPGEQGDAIAAANPGLCAASGSFSTTGTAVTLTATVPEVAGVSATSIVGVLDAQVASVLVCPEDRDNRGQCVPCTGADAGTLDCHANDTFDDFVGEGLERQFLAKATLTDDSVIDVTRSNDINWTVSATGIDPALLGSVQAATGEFVATGDAVDQCSTASVEPCQIGVNATLDSNGNTFTGISSVDLAEIVATAVTVTSDPSPACISSTDPLNLLGDATAAELTAAVDFVAVDVTGTPIAGSEFTDPDFPALWEATTGQWDGTMCTPGLSLPTDPANVSSRGTVTPAGPLSIGQACVTGTAQNDLTDPADDVVGGITVAVDVVGPAAVNCAAIGG